MKAKEFVGGAQKQVRLFPLGVKLALILGVIVLLSLCTITALSSYFISQDVRITAEENNFSTNTRAASTMNDKISTIRSNVFQLLDLISIASGGSNSALSKQAQSFFFERNQDIASIRVLEHGSNLYRRKRQV